MFIPANVAAWRLFTIIVLSSKPGRTVTKSETSIFCSSSPADIPVITVPIDTSPHGVDTTPFSMGQLLNPVNCRLTMSFGALQVQNVVKVYNDFQQFLEINILTEA